MTPSDTLMQLLSQRRSCRAFKPDPVPPHIFEEVVGAAQHVPSWCNAQPWQVHACDLAHTDALRHALSAHAKTAPVQPDIPFPTAYEGAYQERRREVGWQLYDAVGVRKGDRTGSAQQAARNFLFFDAPHVAIITTPKALGPYGVLDCGAFVTAVLLGLEARGLAGVALASLASYAPFLRDWFALAPDRDVVCGLAWGHADPDHPANSFRPARAAVGDVLRWQTR